MRQGECQQAISYLQQAIALHREAGYQHGETATLRTLAEAVHRTGQPQYSRGSWSTTQTDMGRCCSGRLRPSLRPILCRLYHLSWQLGIGKAAELFKGFLKLHVGSRRSWAS